MNKALSRSPLLTGLVRNQDIWQVLTGLFLSAEDEFVVQAFTRAQVFRPDCAILVLVGLIGGKCAIGKIIKGFKHGKLAD